MTNRFNVFLYSHINIYQSTHQLREIEAQACWLNMRKPMRFILMCYAAV